MTQSDLPPSDDPTPDPVPPPENPVPPADIPTLSPTKDDRNLALLAHLTGIFTTFLGPLIIWLMKKESSPYVEDQAREALNFQITILIGYLISGIAVFICIGPILAVVISILSIIFGIIATIAASKGEPYRYPFALRLVQ